MRSSHNGDSSEIFGTNRFATDKLPHAASPIRTTIANLRWLPPYLYTTHPDHVQTILRARAGGGGSRPNLEYVMAKAVELIRLLASCHFDLSRLRAVFSC